jgi:hypothetical protein
MLHLVESRCSMNTMSAIMVHTIQVSGRHHIHHDPDIQSWTRCVVLYSCRLYSTEPYSPYNRKDLSGICKDGIYLESTNNVRGPLDLLDPPPPPTGDDTSLYSARHHTTLPPTTSDQLVTAQLADGLTVDARVEAAVEVDYFKRTAFHHAVVRRPPPPPPPRAAGAGDGVCKLMWDGAIPYTQMLTHLTHAADE